MVPCTLNSRTTAAWIDIQEKKNLPHADALYPWKEAIMLGLSWNSCQEKLTEKMCKPGQDQQKLEMLMDEMDLFRRRAIELSERLLRE